MAKANQSSREPDKLQERIDELKKENTQLQRRNEVLERLFVTSRQRISMLADDLDAHGHRAQNLIDQGEDEQ